MGTAHVGVRRNASCWCALRTSTSTRMLSFRSFSTRTKVSIAFTFSLRRICNSIDSALRNSLQLAARETCLS